MRRGTLGLVAALLPVAEACRAGLRLFEEDARVTDRLVALGQEGMSSGIDDAFDIDVFMQEMRAT